MTLFVSIVNKKLILVLVGLKKGSSFAIPIDGSFWIKKLADWDGSLGLGF